MTANATKPLLFGVLASLVMLSVYFGVLTPISGWEYTVSEFGRFWPYLIALSAGFGTQIGLYVHLKQLLMHHHTGGTMVVASGTTSTAAMISCCAHYLVNVLPVVGAAGFVTLVAEYQVELFWVGLAFNIAGIAFIGSRVLQARGQHA
jgi:Cu+-exporting ATPase